MKINDFVLRGVSVMNNMGELRTTKENSICFPNGWVASIIDYNKFDNNSRPERKKRFSVAVCDYDGYFNWEILIPFGAGKEYGNGYGVFLTDDEEEVCKILSIIEQFESILDDEIYDTEGGFNGI